MPYMVKKTITNFRLITSYIWYKLKILQFKKEVNRSRRVAKKQILK